MKTIKIICVAIIAVSIGSYMMLSSIVTNVPVGIVGVRTQEYALLGKRASCRKISDPAGTGPSGPSIPGNILTAPSKPWR